MAQAGPQVYQQGSTLLSTELLTILASFSALALAVAALFVTLSTRRDTAAAANYVASQNKRSLSLKKMAEVEATLSELTDAYDALLTSHKKLRSRIGMRANRQEKKDNEIPDPTKDPAGYKKAMRLKLNAQR